MLSCWAHSRQQMLTDHVSKGGDYAWSRHRSLKILKGFSRVYKTTKEQILRTLYLTGFNLDFTIQCLLPPQQLVRLFSRLVAKTDDIRQVLSGFVFC